ncbi:MAG TPA: hypothetical protein VKQ05_01885, partial [Gemmatimonadales bacterium]|nr:hypothetical protein [Gemmatimonadales bacterium]
VAKRDDAINREIATAATTAFAENRIDGSDLDSYLTASIVSERERGLLKNVALAKQALMRRELTSAEAKACVLAGILPVSDYRAALERERYAPDAADALEMLLRYEQDKRASIATHAAQMAAEKAAAAKAKADAAAAKKAEIDAARAVKKLGSISELEHAVVLGTIPISRLEQVLTADFDTDTVGIYVADVEQKRAAYVAQQQKAADAAKRAAAKGLAIGTLDQAALDHVLTVDQVGAQLTARGMTAADVDVILATLRVRVTDHDAALKKRAEAATKATAKHIDLARFEQLVLRGHRTMPDYKSLLATLGYDDASQAAMAELLQLKVDAAAAAVQTRKTLAASAPAKGRALAAARRAVILGAASLDSFQTFLVTQGYTADVQATLTGELRDDVAAADAARARRAQAAGVSDAHDVPLATVTRAARLGIITPAAYQAQLTERGYTADDNALEMDLLTYELAHTKAVAKLLPTTAAIAPSKGLTLAELSRAVKTGEAAIGEFTNRALALGYSQADAQIMTAVLQDEVDTLAAAKLRHTQVDGELAARTISLSAEEKAVVDGLQTLDQYETWLTANGLGAADAQLLRALLETKLPPTTASTAGGA